MALTPVYTVDDQPPVFGTAHLLTEQDVDDTASELQAILHDHRGVQEALEALSEIPSTNFDRTRLADLLAAPTSFEEWRVGEALAEHHLSTELGCEFPWPDSRSTRNPNSSGGGVDLIGFQGTDEITFVFAEVKTSHQQQWPPSLVTSRNHGLYDQIRGLNSGDDRSRWAIRYLAMNAVGKPWLGKLQLAMKAYLANQLDISIFGVLIHMTDPNEADLRSRASTLASEVASPTRVSLIAIYLSAELLKRAVNGPIALETAA